MNYHFSRFQLKINNLFFSKSLEEQNITSRLTGVSDAYRCYGSTGSSFRFFADVLLLSSLRMSFPVDYACASFLCLRIACVCLPCYPCESVLLLSLLGCWPHSGRVQSCVSLVATIESGCCRKELCQLRGRSWDSTEEGKTYKGKGVLASLEILLHAIYYLSPQTYLSLPMTRCCDHPPQEEQRAHARRVRGP